MRKTAKAHAAKRSLISTDVSNRTLLLRDLPLTHPHFSVSSGQERSRAASERRVVMRRSSK